jgi:hypothetical protein
MLADELDYVVGVDTHRDSHALAVVAASSGGVVVVEPSLSACPEGYRGCSSWHRPTRPVCARSRSRGRAATAPA